MKTKPLKQALGAIRRADERFHMIEPGDRIAVGLSGGKDSVLLLTALAYYRNFCKTDFELCALTVDLGFGGFDTSPLEELCVKLCVPFHRIVTSIGPIVFDIRRESNPCALCAKMRKGAFYRAANELNCNKSAYAHHRDDVIATFLLSLLYEGRLSTFEPVSHLSRCGVTLIRPFVYLPEKKIVAAVRALSLPVVKNPCPASGGAKRAEAEELIREMSKKYPKFPEMTMAAIDARLWGGKKEDASSCDFDIDNGGGVC